MIILYILATIQGLLAGCAFFVVIFTVWNKEKCVYNVFKNGKMVGTKTKRKGLGDCQKTYYKYCFKFEIKNDSKVN